MDEVYLEEATKSVIELLQQITEKLNTLESIDKSISMFKEVGVEYVVLDAIT